jgi:hypothetical protein
MVVGLGLYWAEKRAVLLVVSTVASWALNLAVSMAVERD